ncbi:putative secreted protein [Hartmannibacter diazotrophicus]|uniref:Putative secreted protein n=1 Tax=Hartmannibacter diazotrophicus TaxID=1482074 RepID=A0A2C9D410_9HYPH|nr:thiosulfate oxidation carrier complex protein SoxZ [Hartmannibacter diazotrophicus]SON55016.1 putative secreted protein [Hartmannibacter diazotrophicus]
MTARVRLPDTITAGESFPIRTLISHPMETGFRRDSRTGERIPRRIIHRFECSFDGETVFTCDLGPSMAANPYLEFEARIEHGGTFRFVWVEDGGGEFMVERPVAPS